MKSTLLLSTLWIILLSGCNTNNNIQINPINSWNENTGTIVNNDIQEPLVDITSGDNNSYTLFFDDMNTTKSFTIYHKADQKDYVYFINDWFTKLNLKITLPESETWANLRLSQIIMPDGMADWPFDKELSYDLSQNWWYQLVFHENTMAGDPWTGNAQVTITLSK